MIRCIWLTLINIIAFVLAIVVFILIPFVIPIFPFVFIVIFIAIPLVILVVIFIVTFTRILVCWRENPPVRIDPVATMRQDEVTGEGGVSKDT